MMGNMRANMMLRINKPVTRQNYLELMKQCFTLDMTITDIVDVFASTTEGVIFLYTLDEDIKCHKSTYAFHSSNRSMITTALNNIYDNKSFKNILEDEEVQAPRKYNKGGITLKPIEVKNENKKQYSVILFQDLHDSDNKSEEYFFDPTDIFAIKMPRNFLAAGVSPEEVKNHFPMYRDKIHSALNLDKNEKNFLVEKIKFEESYAYAWVRTNMNIKGHLIYSDIVTDLTMLPTKADTYYNSIHKCIPAFAKEPTLNYFELPQFIFSNKLNMLEKLNMWNDYNKKSNEIIENKIIDKVYKGENRMDEKGEVKVELLGEEKEINKDIKVIDELELLEKVTGDTFRLVLVYNHDVHYFYLKELPSQKDIPNDIMEYALSHKLYTYEKVGNEKGEA